MSGQLPIENVNQNARIADTVSNITPAEENGSLTVDENATQPVAREDSTIGDEDIHSILRIQGEVAPSELGDAPESVAEPLPSVVFMIPLPAPMVGRRSKNTTPFLI
jgi:hypothetical protein